MGLPDGVPEGEAGVGLWDVGLADVELEGVGVAVTVTVVVVVTTGLGVTVAVADGPPGVEGSELDRAGSLLGGASVGVAGDRDGTPDAFAVGRLTVGPLGERVGAVALGAGDGSPLVLRLGDTDGTDTERLGVAEPSPLCPQPVRAKPTQARDMPTRTRFICCS